MTQSRALLYALVGFFLWVACDSVVKLGGQEELSPFLILAVLGLTGFISIGGSALARKNAAALRPQNGRFHALICLCGIGVNLANVIALKYLPLTVFYIAVFTCPLVIACLAALLKFEVLTKTKILCLLAGFAGVVYAVSTRTWESGEALGYIAVFSSVLCFAASALLMRKIACTETAESLQFFRSGAIALFGFLGLWFVPGGQTPGLLMLGILFFSGILNVIGNLLNNKALQYTDASNVEQLHYTQLVWGALIGYLFWNEVPTLNLLIGSAVIVAAGMIVARDVHKSEVSAALLAKK